jgi:large conductance mechanosensitive channel
MKNMVSEFKEFINRGNLVELSIAFVLALFFAPIVTSIVNGVVLNLIAAIFGQPDFSSIVIDVGDSQLLIGDVLTAIVNFLIVAFVCFLIIKAYNHFKDEDPEAGPSEVDLLVEIRDELRSRSS